MREVKNELFTSSKIRLPSLFSINHSSTSLLTVSDTSSDILHAIFKDCHAIYLRVFSKTGSTFFTLFFFFLRGSEDRGYPYEKKRKNTKKKINRWLHSTIRLSKGRSRNHCDDDYTENRFFLSFFLYILFTVIYLFILFLL